MGSPFPLCCSRVSGSAGGAGLLVGWRTDAPAVSVLGGFALLALFAYSFLWIGAIIGLGVARYRRAASR